MDAADADVAEGKATVSDGLRWCGRCYQKRLNGLKIDDKQPEHTANNAHGSGGEVPVPPDPLDTVRAMVEDVVRRGEILYWQDVAAWVTAERAKLGMEELQGR